MKAKAYESLPGRSGTAAAILGLFSPIGLALPVVMGAVADRASLSAAIAVTAAAPLAILVLGPRDPMARRINFC